MSRKSSKYKRKNPESVTVRPAFNLLPKTEKQAQLITAIKDKTLIVAYGPAGTGKTFVSGMCAARSLLKGDVDNLVLTRANVPTGRTLGSFPGTVEEKLAPWLAPLVSVLEVGLGKADVKCRMGKSILVQPLETIRGQSFTRSIILVDEAQNLSFEEIKAITTRIGDGSKLVLMGDPTQSDVKNGTDLMRFVGLCHKRNIEVPIVKFGVDDIVRSDIVGQLVRMFYEEDI